MEEPVEQAELEEVPSGNELAAQNQPVQDGDDAM